MSDRPSAPSTPATAGRSAGLLDTSVVIDIDLIEVALLPDETAISAVTLAELAAGPHAVDEHPPDGGGGAKRRPAMAAVPFQALRPLLPST